MVTFRDVLTILKYSSKQEMEGIAQLLLMQDSNGKNAFDNWILSLNTHENKWNNESDALPEIPLEWQCLYVKKEIWMESALIKQVLDHEMTHSWSACYKFLDLLLQAQLFVPKFSNFSGKTNMYELDEKKNMPLCIKVLLKKLGFCDERDYCPEDREINTIFLHAATELALCTRFKQLSAIVKTQNKPVKICYSTNPRGLSKVETSTAEILATWFTEDRSLQKKIEQCLRPLFANKEFTPDWYRDLNKLQATILSTVNAECKTDFCEFPSAPDGNKYDPIYDETARLDGNRDPLANKWPHIGHLLQHLAKKFDLDEQQITFEILLVPGKQQGGKYIPAKTRELVEAFLQQISFPPGEEHIIHTISDNSITYGASRQDLTVKLLLAERQHQIQQGNENAIEVITYHDAMDTESVDQVRAFKEVAAKLHTYSELNLHFIEELDKQMRMEERVTPSL